MCCTLLAKVVYFIVMFIGQLVKFRTPCIAKFCSPEGTSDFIIEDSLTGVILSQHTNMFGCKELEVFAAGEILFSIDCDDVQIVC
tara:strand:- start:505 stop:759 length:255 start_codon:yes stop_codon:yes gene_type:complete